MKFGIFTAWAIFFVVFTSFNNNNSLQHPFYEGILAGELVLKAGNDSISADIYIARDTLRQPVFYYSDIFTPVCEDKLCKPLQIRLYWDACASFLGFYVDGANPLTKKDHIEFTAGDYYLLYSILNDTDSKLSKIDYHKLTRVKAAYNNTDAVSGATNGILSSLVVPGAAYTTYALWKLSHNGKLEELVNKTDSNALVNKKITVAEFKKRIGEFNTISQEELAYLLEYAHEHNILRKYAIQEKLVNCVNTLPPINALLVNNYLRRQNNIEPHLLRVLANSLVLENVFKAMIPV